jgi:hypothetical protein
VIRQTVSADSWVPQALLQVVQDVPDGHAVRVQADDHVIQAAGGPPGPLGHQ